MSFTDRYLKKDQFGNNELNGGIIAFDFTIATIALLTFFMDSANKKRTNW